MSAYQIGTHVMSNESSMWNLCPQVIVIVKQKQSKSNVKRQTTNKQQTTIQQGTSD